LDTLPVTPGGTGGASILVAEDHPDSRDALSALLQAVGYRVFVAGDGREAVDRALELKPDLILMDIMMPEIDGLTATRMLRADASFDGTPILALTAMEGARDQAIDAGCDDFVTKPIDVNVFFGKVKSWLETGTGD
jgi:two-component system cell cycle response regulator DivK